jgi:hypothetical protein
MQLRSHIKRRGQRPPEAIPLSIDRLAAMPKISHGSSRECRFRRAVPKEAAASRWENLGVLRAYFPSAASDGPAASRECNSRSERTRGTDDCVPIDDTPRDHAAHRVVAAPTSTMRAAIAEAP